MITSAAFQGDYLKGSDLRLIKIYYTNQRTLDTLSSYISRSNWIKRSDTSKRDNGKIDTVEVIDAFKIVGADRYPLYVRGKDCLKLFTGTMRYLINVDLGRTSVYNAMDQLMVECYRKFLHRNSDDISGRSHEDPFRRIDDTPRIKAKANN